MKARPILFSGPMIRALLEGRKTQTRRVVKPQPEFENRGITGITDAIIHWKLPPVSKCPYGKPGDLLWVREAWRASKVADELPPRLLVPGHSRIHYEADSAVDWTGRYRHARFMPRWASRSTLRITDVRVQRLQDISEADAKAEGVQMENERCWVDYLTPGTQITLSAQQSFDTLWESINGPGSWEANPWCWALTFDVIKANVDQVMSANKGGE